MKNARYKWIKSWQELAKFLRYHPGHFILDTGDPENRYRVTKSATNKIGGISVDGRSVRALAVRGKAKIVRLVNSKTMISNEGTYEAKYWGA